MQNRPSLQFLPVRHGAVWARPRPFAAAFTLVELLVVISILGLLMAILLPTLGKVRESSRRVKCAANLRSLGHLIVLFANDHNDRVPEGQNTPYAGQGGWNATWMYSKDYFVLVDDYGADQRLFICPSTPTAEIGPSAFIYGEGSETLSRAGVDDLPENPRKVSDGEEDLSDYWVQFDYQYMGRNVQETYAPGGLDADGAPFEVTKLTRNTHTGTDDDANPPLLCDRAWYQPSTGYHFNHGSHWSIPSFTPSSSLRDCPIRSVYAAS